MTKADAIKLFGGRATDLARALKKTRSAISQWPVILDENKQNIVLGAAVRRGIHIPEYMKR